MGGASCNSVPNYCCNNKDNNKNIKKTITPSEFMSSFGENQDLFKEY
jgi:hypothetical protein